MSQSFRPELIERGNTQKGVSLTVAQLLHEWRMKNPGRLKSLFDIPCGQGEFLRSLQRVFPDLQLRGLDLMAEPHDEIKDLFIRGDAREPFGAVGGQKFDAITCISGVMCFDHVSGFFSSCRSHLNPGGHLIVTNDNVLTMRDRLSFLFLGHLKRFKLLYSIREGNWNVVLIQGLWKQFRANGFRIERVTYTSFYPEDLLFLPLALVIYPIWWLNIMLRKSEMSRRERHQLFPFRSLMCRHYVVWGRLDSN